jgi:hypothetical protein
MCGARATFQEEWRLLEASDALVMGHRHGCRGLAELMYAPVCHRDIVPELLYRGALLRAWRTPSPNLVDQALL